MKREAIERLAVDLSAGQLNEDIQALFNEYVAEHPETNKWLLDMQEIYKTTESAIISKIETGSTAVQVQIPHFSKWQPIARWAAVIILAAFIGASVGRWTKKPVLEIKKEFIKVQIYQAQTNKSVFNIDNLSEGFWRDKITVMLNPSSAKEQTSYNNGASLLDRYTQYIKEKHYE
jgi:hypothetical protein